MISPYDENRWCLFTVCRKGNFPIDHLSRISASGSNLDEAKERLKKLVPDDLVLTLSYYRSDYGIQAIKENGETDDIAIRKVETRIPRNAKIVSKKLTVKSTSRNIQVSVNGSLKDALDEARYLIGPSEVVRTGKLVSPSTQGIFGVGAKKAVYLVNVGQMAIAEAVYETPVDLTGCVGSAQMKNLIDQLKEWYKAEALKNSFLFLPDKRCEECGKPLKNNPFVTPNHVLCENCTNLFLGTTNWSLAIKHINLHLGPGVPKTIIETSESMKHHKKNIE